MYGGVGEPNDYAAMKSAGNEMLGLLAYYNANVPGLYFPLVCLLEYRGFRVIANSVLPINGKTLKYGSNDGGHSVIKDIPELNKKMKEAAARINLCGHNVIHNNNQSVTKVRFILFYFISISSSSFDILL